MPLAKQNHTLKAKTEQNKKEVPHAVRRYLLATKREKMPGPKFPTGSLLPPLLYYFNNSLTGLSAHFCPCNQSVHHTEARARVIVLNHN